jgi:hypothetical protein
MIFAVWTLYWIYASATPWMLVVPALAVIVRAGYVARPLANRAQTIALAFSLLMFLYQLALRESLLVAALASLKMLVASLVLNHLFIGLREVNPALLGADVGTFLVVFDRCIWLLLDRMGDAFENRQRD